jgi:hypothetical protein
MNENEAMTVGELRQALGNLKDDAKILIFISDDNGRWLHGVEGYLPKGATTDALPTIPNATAYDKPNVVWLYGQFTTMYRDEVE